MPPASLPVAALTTLGILIAVLGLFATGSLPVVVIGLLSIAGGRPSGRGRPWLRGARVREGALPRPAKSRRTALTIGVGSYVR